MLCWCVKNSKSDEPYTSVHLKPFIIIEDSTFSHAPETMSISYCLFKGLHCQISSITFQIALIGTLFKFFLTIAYN